jgi:sulfoxide reductase catalytic subunit YedY
VVHKRSRRWFLRVAALGGLGALAAACRARSGEAGPTPSRVGPAGEGTVTAQGPTPVLAPTRSPLGNENRPAVKPMWNVRYYRAYYPVDHDQWRLKVEGLVKAPQSFSLGDLLALQRYEQDTRMKCVECWSARAVFAGFTYASLAEIVQPLPQASWVHFVCADGYYESLSVEELGHGRVFFALEMDGELLLDEFGAPLRLVMPHKYGYKWPKAITHLVFEDSQRGGLWSDIGPYSPDGAVQAGFDAPLDDPGVTHRISGGEITEY